MQPLTFVCSLRGEKGFWASPFSSFSHMLREDLKTLLLWSLCQNHSLLVALRLPSLFHAALGCMSLRETLAQHQWQSIPQHKFFWWSKERRKHLVLFYFVSIFLNTYHTHTESSVLDQSERSNQDRSSLLLSLSRPRCLSIPLDCCVLSWCADILFRFVSAVNWHIFLTSPH